MRSMFYSWLAVPSRRQLVSRRAALLCVVTMTVALFGTSRPLAGATATPTQKCAVAKSKAAAKKLTAKLKCVQKATLLGAPSPDPLCIATAEAKYMTAIEKAEAKGGCAVVGDADRIEETVDECVGAISSLTTGL